MPERQSPKINRIENMAGDHDLHDVLAHVEGRWGTLQKVYWTDAVGRHHEWERLCRTTHSRRQGMIQNNQQLHVPNPASQVPSGITKPDATAVLTLTYHKSKTVSSTPLLQREDIEVVLVKQFRPPLCAYSLEFPAGLIDEGEDPVAAGIRELKEETGYTAEKVLHVSPQLSLAPGNSTESCILVIASVDLDDPVNQNPKQQLDESEDIEVFRVPLKCLVKELDKFRQSGGIVFEEVYCKD